MKVIVILVVAGIILVTAGISADFYAEQKVYQFCSSIAAGNTIEEVNEIAETQSFINEQTTSVSMVFVTSDFTIFEQSACVLDLQDGVVVSQSLIKR